MGALDGGSAVYVPHEEAGWVAATVLSSLGEGKFEVKLLAVEDGEGRKDEAAGQVAIYETKHAAFEGMDLGGGLPLQNIDTSEEGVADMTRLNHLHEPAILFNLRQRFLVKGFPYTYTGDIVIALNPYRWLDLYSPSIAARYAGMQHGQRSSEPPHVFSTSAIAFHGLKSTGRNQSILVSGESGAGKTETVKILLSHLASMAKGVGGTVNMEESSVMRTIIQSNPLLESFGNAKTVRNDNSSRFGKFTRLQFSEQGDMACAMVGSLCTTYLLEKSRVVGHSAGERNYHIFYQMCAAGEERKAKWGLAGLQARDFDYLTADGREADAVIEGKTDGARFDITCEALGLLGLSASDLDELFSALAGVMFLGQVKFENSDDEESSRVAGPVTSLEAPAKLLRLDSVSDLEGAMTHRTVRARREVIRTPNRADAAASTRDSMAKAIYSAAFDWLVSHINSSTSRGTGGKTINLLDIFGFESFTVNRFEQLCINYANEKLQQKFTQDVFKTVQLEYEDEGVPWEHVSFPDNSEVLWLIESTTGVLSILDEECIIPRGSDERFASKLGSIHEGHPAFVKNKLVSPTFALKHYAGMVTYQAEGFLDKNRDAVGEAVVNLLRESESQLLANAFRSSAFPSSPSSSRGGSSRSTLASTFKANLADLITSVNSTSVQYVRCIKPNSTKSPGAIENMKVLEQLRCAGVIEAIRISRAAYPNRLLHSQFFARFMVLHRECTDSMSLREALVESGNMPESGFQWGRTRVYFKSGALESLEEMRLVCRQTAALLLQANVRMWISAAQFRKKRTATILLQANWRRVAAFARFATAKRRIVILQAKWRAIQARAVVVALCANTAASKVAATWLMSFQRRKYMREKRAAIDLQAIMRMSIARRQYAVSLHEYREAQKLENQIAALQARLAAEQEARLKMEEETRELALKLEHTKSKSVSEVSDPVLWSPGSKAVAKRLFQEDAHFSAMLDESQQIIFALRTEVQKLKSQNDALLTETADLKREKHKNAATVDASGLSIAAAGQSLRRMSTTNRSLAKQLADSKAECDKLREAMANRLEEQKALRLLLDSEMLMRNSQLKCMESMLLSLARTDPPINGDRKDELVHEMNAIYRHCARAETDVSMIMLQDDRNSSRTSGVFNQIKNFTAAFTPLRGTRR